MTDVCKDTVESRNTDSLISTDGFAYSPTIQIYQLDKLRADFEKNTVARSAYTDNFVSLYTQDTFNQGLITFNNFLLASSTNINLNLPVNYPLVNDRIAKGVAITTVEYIDFMEDVGYNPITIQGAVTTGPKNVLSLYNTHINGRFSKSTMGTFCELAPAIFGAIAGFFTSIRNFANTINDIINKIQNFSLAALLDTLKKKIMSVIENTIEKVKKIIENFSIDNLVSEVNKFFHDKIINKFFLLKEKAMKFFESLNVENFKKKIEGIISYATNIFKDPKIEEIQFLIYRFCSFITQVEDLINSIKNPLEAFSNNYVYAGNILKSNSYPSTIDAVNAGANRPTEGDVAAAIARGISLEAARGNQPPPTTEEKKDLPPWNEGQGNSILGFQGGWTAPPGAGCNGGMGSEGWEWESDIFFESKIYLMRVYKEFSRRTGISRIIVNSAYRSPKYNQCLRDRGVKAARNSFHMQGVAFDITWAGYPNNRDVFIEVARSFGFKGIGVYTGNPGFVHIDRRETPYSWNG
jgi:hypothetical protein